MRSVTVQPRRIRPLALAVVRNGDAVLVGRGHDPVKGETFYRPLGGAIEFGERSAEALVREIREELGAEAVNPRLLGWVENLFTYDGRPGHEIIALYEVDLADRALYDRTELPYAEDGGSAGAAVWRRLTDFGPGRPPLYPDGLLELIVRTAQR
jgi:ADP-ribose pyrophosphatase YjhB (NUDIX family)